MSTKTCVYCKSVKLLDDFHKNNGKADGHQSCCKACSREYSKRYYAAHKQDWQKKHTERQTTDEAYRNRAKTRAADWYKDNSTRARGNVKAWAERNPEKTCEYKKRWAASNQEIERQRKRVREAKRRAIKFQAIPIWANPALIEDFYYTADMLGMHTGEAYHVDHMVPLCSKLVCGLHVESNLQILPGVENCSKGNRHWPDMPERM